MLELRLLDDADVPLVESWLNTERIKRWYEIPRLGVTIADWMAEISARRGEFKWITYLIALRQGCPIGFCLHYNCADSDEDFGSLPTAGSYGIDYLIGEEAYLGKGLGREMIFLLLDTIFTFPDALRVTADIDKDNTISAKTLLSCGFTLLDEGGSRYVIHGQKYKEAVRTSRNNMKN